MFCQQNLGLGLKLFVLFKVPKASWAWLSAYKICELIDFFKVLFFPGNTSFAISNISAYGAFIFLWNIVNNIFFSHYCNTVIKNIILFIMQVLKILLLNCCMSFCFIYTYKLNKYTIHFTKTNSIIPAQL